MSTLPIHETTPKAVSQPPARLARENAGMTVEAVALFLRPGYTGERLARWVRTVKGYDRTGYPLGWVIRGDFALSKRLGCQPHDLCAKPKTNNKSKAPRGGFREQGGRSTGRTRATRSLSRGPVVATGLQRETAPKDVSRRPV